MAIQKEIWENDIVEGLYKENQFLTKAYNADSYVLAGKVVHIPQAGAPAAVVKNRSSLPATVVQRTDVDITYAMNEFTTDPVLIPNIDTIQLSYDKRQSVMGENLNALNELVADWMLRNWAPAAATQILRTLGADRAGEANAIVTGNRKMFTKETILKLQKAMNKQNVPKQGRVLLLPSEFLGDLMADTDLIKRDTAKEADYVNGIVSRLFGFDIYERSSVLTYTNAGTPVVKDPGAAGAVTDNATALAWHPSVVERALGTVKVFDNTDDPTYYGDIYSALVMSGGRIRRNDGLGIFAVVEAAGS
jgi:hypothetical protein